MTPSWHPDPDSGVRVREQRAGGLAFELAEAGTGDHLALLLHGFPELAFSWRHQIPVLAGMGYRVWAPCLRGYGGSDRPSGVAAYSLDRLLDDVAALIDASGAARVTLVGHDWGGALAWQVAIRRLRPIERLVILNLPHPAGFGRALRRWPQRRRSWYMGAFQLPWVPERVLLARRAAMIRRIFRGMAVNRDRFPPAVLDVYAAAALRPGAMTAMLNWYRAIRLARPATGRVAVPTLVIWGEQDAALGLDTLDGIERDVPGVTLCRLPDASHWVQTDAPDMVNAILRAWLPHA